jgi:hypothetical protein
VSRSLRIAWRAAIGVAAFVVVLASAAFAINAFDEKLSARTEALLRPFPNPYRADENAFLLLLGIDAPTSESVVAAGEVKVEEFEHEALLLVTDPTAALAQLKARVESPDPRRLKVKAPDHFCEGALESVWDTFATRRSEVLAIVADNRELLARYATLRRARGYYDTAAPRVTSAVAFLPSGLHCLFLANTAVGLRADGIAARRAALVELGDDVRLWQAVVIGDGVIASKAIAARMLRSDFLLLADAVAAAPLARTAGSLSDLEDAVLGTPDQWNIARAFARQLRGSAVMFSDIDAQTAAARLRPPHDDRGWWQRATDRLANQFWKPNSTLNLEAMQTEQAMVLASTDPAGWGAALERYGDWCEHELGPSEPFFWLSPVAWLARRSRSAPLGFAYNPAGHAHVASMAPYDARWVRFIADSVAVQRAARLSLEIRRAGVASEAVPQFLREHPAWSTHPIGAVPFTWDAAAGTITARPAADISPSRRMWIRISPQPSSG